jgi:hypothetical protein
LDHRLMVDPQSPARIRILKPLGMFSRRKRRNESLGLIRRP